MRLVITTSPNTHTVPYNYQNKLMGVVHKWLGHNDLHGHMALHSYSWLRGGKASTRAAGLEFAQGAQLFITFYQHNHISDLISGIFAQGDMFSGLRVANVEVRPVPDLSHCNRLLAASPIFLRELQGDRQDHTLVDTHYTYEDDPATTTRLLTDTLHHKMQLAGLEHDPTLLIRFDPQASRRQTKLVHYRHIQMRTSLCPVLIEGLPASKAFAWCVGVGASTGIGMGAVIESLNY